MILFAAGAKASLAVTAVLAAGVAVLMLMFWLALAWAAFKKMLSVIKVLVIGFLITTTLAVGAVAALGGGLFIAGMGG